jgi:hypothetical protein
MRHEARGTRHEARGADFGLRTSSIAPRASKQCIEIVRILSRKDF